MSATVYNNKRDLYYIIAVGDLKTLWRFRCVASSKYYW